MLVIIRYRMFCLRVNFCILFRTGVKLGRSRKGMKIIG